MRDNKYFQVIEAQSLIENQYEYDKWRSEIPYIKLDPEWEIRVIPPFSGAVARFNVKQGEAGVSVYLDCYDRLGYVGEPYWEVFPYEGDVHRVYINDTDELVETIRKSIKDQLEEVNNAE